MCVGYCLLPRRLEGAGARTAMGRRHRRHGAWGCPRGLGEGRLQRNGPPPPPWGLGSSAGPGVGLYILLVKLVTNAQYELFDTY